MGHFWIGFHYKSNGILKRLDQSQMGDPHQNQSLIDGNKRHVAEKFVLFHDTHFPRHSLHPAIFDFWIGWAPHCALQRRKERKPDRDELFSFQYVLNMDMIRYRIRKRSFSRVRIVWGFHSREIREIFQWGLFIKKSVLTRDLLLFKWDFMDRLKLFTQF